MPRLTTAIVTKAVVSVSEMARMCGISRGHFHALIKNGVFPHPVYCTRTRRPLYLAEFQQICLQVRATSIGADGRYVIFYGERDDGDGSQARSTGGHRNRATGPSRHADLIEGLKALGLAAVTDQQVAMALTACFPGGTDVIEEGQVLRTIWQHIRRTSAA